MRTVAVAGLEIAYARAGEGPPLVLLHGAGDDHRAWGPQVAALAGELTVIAWDEPGAGRSSDLPPGWTLADHAACLAALIDEVADGPVRLGGISWGGTVALELVRRHPALVTSLILADTYAGWRGSLRAEEIAARLAALDAEPGRVPGLFAGAPPPEAQALVAAMAADARPATLAVLAGQMATADLRDALPGIAVPTLLVWGEEDVRSPPAVARAFAAAIPHAELVLIPACGHLANLERPEAFTAAVRDFCRRHPASPDGRSRPGRPTVQ